jgi:ribonucleoside-diphosphate reductase alpha chain
MERIAKTGTVQHAEVPAKWQRVFGTANAISPEMHVRMQAASPSPLTDSAISKDDELRPTRRRSRTCGAIYELAYELRCKGVTVYRDGSRDGQVLSTAPPSRRRRSARRRRPAASRRRPRSRSCGREAADGRAAGHDRRARGGAGAHQEVALRRRGGEPAAPHQARAPEKLRSTSIRKETPLGTMFIHISEDDRGQPFDVFLNLGKAGGSAMADAEALGRTISLALRSGIPLMELIRQLRGISSDRAVGLGPNKVLSMPDAVGIALEEWWRDKQGVQQDLLGGAPARPAAVPATPASRRRGAQAQLGLEGYAPNEVFMGTCPDCGSQLEFAEGCVKCHVCGFSECG